MAKFRLNTTTGGSSRVVYEGVLHFNETPTAVVDVDLLFSRKAGPARHGTYGTAPTLETASLARVAHVLS